MVRSISRRCLLYSALNLYVTSFGVNGFAAAVSPDEARAIAKEAFIWGFPLVDSYRIQHSYFVDTASPEYKGAWNTIHNTARVYTPDDKAIQTPNSDTPYSFVGADLRVESLVLTVPEVDQVRYYSLQFIDMYTFNFTYVGSRATGNGAGSFLLAGPSWKGETPPGIKDVIRSETDFAFVLYRTQLFGADDIDKVKAIQASYGVQPLSAFLHQSAPKPPSDIHFFEPLGAADQKTSAAFFDQLNFILQFCPSHPSEAEPERASAGSGSRLGCRSMLQLLRPRCDRRSRTGWQRHGRNSRSTRKSRSTPGRCPAPTGSARGTFWAAAIWTGWQAPCLGSMETPRMKRSIPHTSPVPMVSRCWVPTGTRCALGGISCHRSTHSGR